MTDVAVLDGTDYAQNRDDAVLVASGRAPRVDLAFGGRIGSGAFASRSLYPIECPVVADPTPKRNQTDSADGDPNWLIGWR